MSCGQHVKMCHAVGAGPAEASTVRPPAAPETRARRITGCAEFVQRANRIDR